MKKTLAIGCQVLGLTSALYGVFLLVGIPWTFLVAGIAVAIVGTLLEAGRL